jgi:Phage integrase, N-terminal SAM-like domain
MPTTLNAVAESYLKAKTLSRGTRNEYFSTLRKWNLWARGIPVEELRRKDVGEFLDWVYERAVADEGTNPGRTANKAREHLRAVISWAWEQEIVSRFDATKPHAWEVGCGCCPARRSSRPPPARRRPIRPDTARR